jgi:uncharacterized Zn finger protein (UPF0148 family)
MCPCCGEEEEEEEEEEEKEEQHIPRAYPELESPMGRNFVQVPPPLRAMSTDQAETARFFREVFDWDLP